MKTTFIGNTRGLHNRLNGKFNGGDILFHCGDFMRTGLYAQEMTGFLEWFKQQPYKYKVLVAGNHDIYCNGIQLGAMFDQYYDDGIRYLEDEEVELDGLRIYGTPYMNWYYGCDAFGLDDGTESLMYKYNMIPDGVDVLLTHNPPYNILDYDSKHKNHLGSVSLYNRLSNMKEPPRFVGFSHTRGDSGKTENGEKSIFINCSNAIVDVEI